MPTKLTTLHTYGKPREDNQIDFLIFLPHVSTDATWVDFARSTFHQNREDITDEVLRSYLYHEADTGTWEVAHSCVEQYQDMDISIGILEVHVPRAFCDMNRLFATSIPRIMDSQKWKEIYDNLSLEIERVIGKSDFCLQLHSMCSFEPTYRFSLQSDTPVDTIHNFLNWCYAGSPRVCNLLTTNKDNFQYSDTRYDMILSSEFESANIPLEYNSAYVLLEDYPATTIMQQIPSSLLEITKWSLANSATIDMIDTNKIVFDTSKIDVFWKILMQSIRSFTHKI